MEIKRIDTSSLLGNIFGWGKIEIYFHGTKDELKAYENYLNNRMTHSQNEIQKIYCY